MAFARCVVVGSGALACGCLDTLERVTKHVEAIESEHHAISFLEGLCRRKSIAYRRIVDRYALTDFFVNVVDPTLVVSAFNRYIFPAAVLANRSLEIINFHNALLPCHRGRNACTWAIYEGDSQTGITWHRVNDEIDSGEIISQTPIAIGPAMTALQLTKSCFDEGIVAFERILPDLLNGTCVSRPQAPAGTAAVHLSSDVPNGRVLDLQWPLEKMSAFLRSLDYGKHRVFAEAVVGWDGRQFKIIEYRVTDGVDPTRGEQCERVVLQGDVLQIREGGRSIDMVLESESDAWIR